MIALLLALALAPVDAPARFSGAASCLEAKTPVPCSFRVAPEWSTHCTLAEHSPRACDYDVRQDAYCIWRSDGTVEAKNATCTDRKGERQ